jgi:ribosomal protein L29
VEDLNQKILQEQIVDPLNQLKKEYAEARQNSFANFVQQPQSNQSALGK